MFAFYSSGLSSKIRYFPLSGSLPSPDICSHYQGLCKTSLEIWAWHDLPGRGSSTTDSLTRPNWKTQKKKAQSTPPGCCRHLAQQVGPSAWLPGTSVGGPSSPLPPWASAICSARTPAHMIKTWSPIGSVQPLGGQGGESRRKRAEVRGGGPGARDRDRTRETWKKARGWWWGSCSDLQPSPLPVPVCWFFSQLAVHGRLKQPEPTTGMFHRSPRHACSPPGAPATRTLMPGSSAFLGSPSLPVEDDWECRLWEEMTIFIVWIKYFSWPSCCLLSVFFPPLLILSFLSSSLPLPLSPCLSLSLSSLPQ